MHHIISATALASGRHLAMCGHVFDSYESAVSDGHPIGNYLQWQGSKSAYHARGVECEACMLAHSRPLLAHA